MLIFAALTDHTKRSHIVDLARLNNHETKEFISLCGVLGFWGSWHGAVLARRRLDTASCSHDTVSGTVPS